MQILLLLVLKDEINFLRNELASKNKFIELIIKDKNSLTAENQKALKLVSSDNSTNRKRLNHKNINNTSNHRVLSNIIVHIPYVINRDSRWLASIIK